MAYEKNTASESKRKSNDPLSKICGSAIYGLRGFIKICKTIRRIILKYMAVNPPPMTIYVEPGILGRSSETSFTPENLINNFNGRHLDGARAWTKDALIYFIDNLTTRNQKFKRSC